MTASKRPTLDEYYMRMAFLAAERATCARRKVGCVLVDKRGRVLTIGYNGVPPKFPHCTDVPCAGATAPKGASRLDLCNATHAEASALLACVDVSRVHTCYTTVSPCLTCTKMLLQTDCQRAVFAEQYDDHRPQEFWETASRTWELVNKPEEEKHNESETPSNCSSSCDRTGFHPICGSGRLP